MTGRIFLCDGTEEVLPRLLSWKLVRTDGTACDSFSVTFLYSAGWEEPLKKAIRFRADDQGSTRFFGIVDEYEVTLDSRGLLAAVHGRGMGGLLLDNQVGLREFYWVRLRDILKNYVEPYGIAVEYERDYFLNAYAVEYGANAWQALAGFCIWAGGIQPRFSENGTLVITSQPGKTVELRHPERVLEARWDCCRYGVYSSVVAKQAGTLQETTVVNQEFQNMGGQAVRRVTIPRKNWCRAGRVSAEMELRQSAERASMLSLTLPELFFAEPGDVVQLALEKLGVQGTFDVAEAENSQSADGTVCRLTMAERR